MDRRKSSKFFSCYKIITIVTVEVMILSCYRYRVTVTHRRPPLPTVTDRSSPLPNFTDRY